MSGPAWIEDLNMLEVLQDVLRDPRSRLFRGGLASAEELPLTRHRRPSVRPRERSFAEEHLVTAYRESFGELLRAHATWSYFETVDSPVRSGYVGAFVRADPPNPRLGQALVTRVESELSQSESWLEEFLGGRPFGEEQILSASQLALRLAPCARARGLLGAIKNHSGDSSGALEVYREALPQVVASPVQGILLSNMASAAKDLMDFDQATVYIEKALDVCPAMFKVVIEASRIAVLSNNERLAQRCLGLTRELGETMERAFQARAVERGTSHGKLWANHWQMIMGEGLSSSPRILTLGRMVEGQPWEG